MLFALQPPKAIVNDTNAELINCYQVIKDEPEELITAANAHENMSEYFYHVRDWDRSPKFALLSPVARAAAVIQVTEMQFNGSFRLRMKSLSDAAPNRTQNPMMPDPAILRAVSRYLNAANVTLQVGGFVEALSDASKGDFAHIDPLSDPAFRGSLLSDTRLADNDKNELRRLKSVCDVLVGRGAQVLVSLCDKRFIRELFGSEHYVFYAVPCRCTYNHVLRKRGVAGELIISNRR